VTGTAVRVSARDGARELMSEWAPGESDPRRAQTAAYRVMPESLLLRLDPVAIAPGWLDRRRARVTCTACGEDVNYQREIVRRGRTLCRACAGDAYYARRPEG
jgi:formylmethanofuran dehydrogenase subunit E